MESMMTHDTLLGYGFVHQFDEQSLEWLYANFGLEPEHKSLREDFHAFMDDHADKFPSELSVFCYLTEGSGDFPEENVIILVKDTVRFYDRSCWADYEPSVLKTPEVPESLGYFADLLCETDIGWVHCTSVS